MEIFSKEEKNEDFTGQEERGQRHHCSQPHSTASCWLEPPSYYVKIGRNCCAPATHSFKLRENFRVTCWLLLKPGELSGVQATAGQGARKLPSPPPPTESSILGSKNPGSMPLFSHQNHSQGKGNTWGKGQTSCILKLGFFGISLRDTPTHSPTHLSQGDAPQLLGVNTRNSPETKSLPLWEIWVMTALYPQHQGCTDLL